MAADLVAGAAFLVVGVALLVPGLRRVIRLGATETEEAPLARLRHLLWVVPLLLVASGGRLLLDGLDVPLLPRLIAVGACLVAVCAVYLVAVGRMRSAPDPVARRRAGLGAIAGSAGLLAVAWMLL